MGNEECWIKNIFFIQIRDSGVCSQSSIIWWHDLLMEVNCLCFDWHLFIAEHFLPPATQFDCDIVAHIWGISSTRLPSDTRQLVSETSTWLQVLHEMYVNGMQYWFNWFMDGHLSSLCSISICEQWTNSINRLWIRQHLLWSVE